MGRTYSLDEATLQQRVVAWFANRGIELRATEDPHVLLSRPKEVNVGVVKGEPREKGQVNRDGEWSAPQTIEREVERARSAALDDHAREATREFDDAVGKRDQVERQEATVGERPYDRKGYDRAAFVERDQWEVRFTSRGPRKTQVLIRRAHASDWSISADKGSIIGTDAMGRASSNVSAVPVEQRDPVAERELAEYLDFSAAVEVVGLEAVRSTTEDPTLKPRVAVPPPPPPTCEVNASSLGLAPAQVVLLSDPAGTAEAPARLAGVVCHALTQHLPLTVALSIPASEQVRLNRWLDSAGTEQDRADLVRGDFWTRLWQDGRSSQSMLGLLERLRAWRAAGHDLAVLAADLDQRGNPRSAFIAARLMRHVREHPERAVLGFFSNTLASKTEGPQWNRDFLPVGYRLFAAGQAVRSFDVAYNVGFQWTCHLSRGGALKCGTWNLVPGPKQRGVMDPSGFRVFPRTSPEGHDGLWFVGTLTASLPAVGSYKDEGNLVGNQQQLPPESASDVPLW